MSIKSFLNKVSRFLKSFWEDVKAYRRGETRVGGRTETGRIYVKKSELPVEGYASKAEPIAEVELKIMRTDGSIEIQKHKARLI